MRVRAVLLVALIVLSGCSGLIGGENTPTPTQTPTSTATPQETTTTTTSTQSATATPSNTTADPDSPVLGYENGYWYNATLSINATDGLNKTEREKVVSRAMARVEYVRKLEFKQTVNISLKTRNEYKQRVSKGNYSSSFRQFDNAKFEAMFLIGEKQDSLATQRKNRGQNVLGFYSPKNDSIVIVSNSETPTLDGETTLAHELTHALQDQHFNLTSYTRVTRDGHNALNGVIEGGASLVQQRYMSHCGKEWDCLPRSQTGGPGAPADWGVYFLNYFPYADGPAFVEYYQQRGGWERINELFENPPVSTEQVIYARKYSTDAPTNVTLEDRTQNGWTRVRPDSPRPGFPRPDYASLGQSALTSMFAQTIFDSYNRSSAIPRQAFINLNGSRVDTSNPFNYNLSVTGGWDGDRMHVYEKNGKTAYVWKIVWDSPKNASQFVAAYHDLLRHWGGTKVDTNTWVIENGPFADAFSVRVSGDTVVIVNAPTVDDLTDVRSRS